MEHITLFTDILPEEQERMRVCFKVREAVFQNGETIMEYSSSMKKIGLIQEGRAVLYCCDEDGNEYVIDELNKDSVFGEPFLLPSDSQHYYVCATTVTKVMFIDYEHVIKRCENACHHHSQMVSNLLQMTALRSRQQTDRIYMLSRSSTRKKLMAYLHSLAAEKNTGKFKLPMSYTALAQYLSVDRSAMMREIKNLSDEGCKGRKLFRSPHPLQPLYRSAPQRMPFRFPHSDILPVEKPHHLPPLHSRSGSDPEDLFLHIFLL